MLLPSVVILHSIHVSNKELTGKPTGLYSGSSPPASLKTRLLRVTDSKVARVCSDCETHFRSRFQSPAHRGLQLNISLQLCEFHGPFIRSKPSIGTSNEPNLNDNCRGKRLQIRAKRLLSMRNEGNQLLIQLWNGLDEPPSRTARLTAPRLRRTCSASAFGLFSEPCVSCTHAFSLHILQFSNTNRLA